MAAKKNTFASRGPIYFGGLLIGLAVGVGFYKAKMAMLPKFHEVQESRDEATMAPGGSVRLVYSEDPGYFLMPGMPTSAVIYKRNENGTSSTVSRYDYGALVDKEPALGPISEEGSYNISGNFYICAEPGVADCTKLVLTQDFKVDRNATAGDDRVQINLTQLAREGLRQGDIKVDEEPAKPDSGDSKAE